MNPKPPQKILSAVETLPEAEQLAFFVLIGDRPHKKFAASVYREAAESLKGFAKSGSVSADILDAINFLQRESEE